MPQLETFSISDLTKLTTTFFLLRCKVRDYFGTVQGFLKKFYLFIAFFYINRH